MVGPRQPGPDPTSAVDVHHREDDLLDLRSDLDRIAEERAHHETELVHGHARQVRRGQLPLHRRPVFPLAEGADATVHEHRATDRARVTSRELERDHRPPRVPGDEGPA